MCEGAWHCDVMLDQCVECLEKLHCSGSAECVDGSCFDPSRPDAGVTIPADGGSTGADAAMPECTDDSMCAPPNTICENQMCVLGCVQPGGLVCMMGDVCDTATGRCTEVLGPCQGDTDCRPPSSVCEGTQCVPGCAERGGIQCAGGMICNAMSGRCEMGGPICLGDGDCVPPTTICNLVTGQCDPGCRTAGCVAPATCNQTTGHCQGGTMCQDDNFEDNDTAAAATSVGAGSQPTLGACPMDDDFYALNLSAGDAVTIDLTFQHGEGNIDVELLNPSGTVVGSGRSRTDNEQITFTAAASGAHIIRVFLTADSGPRLGNPYGMSIALTGTGCAQDGLEPNNARGSAAMVNPGVYAGLNVCEGDEDFYAVTANAGDEVGVDLVFLSFEGDIDLELLDGGGAVLASSTGIFGPENVAFTVAAAGTYYVRVFLAFDLGSNPGNNYFMTLTSGPPSGAMCTEDSFEQNDSAAAAAPLTPGTQSGLTSCAGDEDFYALALSAQDQLTVNVTFTDAEGDIDVQLLDPSGSNVAGGASTTDNETFNYTVTTAGTYALRVWLYADAGSTPGNTYGLQYTRTNAVTCRVDMYEPNDDAASARAMNPGSFSGLGACAGNDDFYSISLTTGQTLTASALFSHAEGDVDMTIIDPAGSVVDSGISSDNDETVSHTATADGVHLVRVYLFRDQGTAPGNTYDLTLSR